LRNLNVSKALVLIELNVVQGLQLEHLEEETGSGTASGALAQSLERNDVLFYQVVLENFKNLDGVLVPFRRANRFVNFNVILQIVRGTEGEDTAVIVGRKLCRRM
jgi:hypothetical protein